MFICSCPKYTFLLLADLIICVVVEMTTSNQTGIGHVDTPASGEGNGGGGGGHPRLRLSREYFHDFIGKAYNTKKKDWIKKWI